MKLTLSAIAVCTLFAFASCSKNNDSKKDTSNVTVNKYADFVTPAIDSVFKTLNINVNKGIHPPKIEGKFVVQQLSIKSNNFNETFRGLMGSDTMTFSNQNAAALSVDFKRSFVKAPGSAFSNDTITVRNCYISGDLDKFTVIINEQREAKNGTQTAKYKVVRVISGKVKYDANYAVVGIDDYQGAYIIKEITEEQPTNWLSTRPNQGRQYWNGLGAVSGYVPLVK